MKEVKEWREEERVILDSPMLVVEDEENGLIKLYYGDDPASAEYNGELFTDEVKELQKEEFVAGIALLITDEGQWFVDKVLEKEGDWGEVLSEASKYWDKKIKFLSPWELEMLKKYKCYGRTRIDDLDSFLLREGGHREWWL